MFSKILGKKKEQETDSELVQKISKMNLTDMRVYVKDNMKDFAISKDGLFEVMRKLTTKDENNQLYLKHDDMDSKKKKAFELVLAIAKSKQLTLKTLELIQIFQEIYKDIIDDYDTKNKQIYSSKFDSATKISIENLKKMAEVKKKMDIIGNV